MKSYFSQWSYIHVKAYKTVTQFKMARVKAVCSFLLYLEQVKNLKHRRTAAKLRSGNGNLRLGSGRHSVPKLPECLRICQHRRSNQIENDNHFLFHCDRYKTIKAGFH